MGHKVIFILAIILTLALSTLAQAEAEMLQTLPEICAVASHARSNCGYPGITREKCQNKGCCFDDKIPGVPWCFYPAVVDEVPLKEECNS
uniref:Trefoil factor 1 n=1 Tax=Loxodonta africana TaxID=9785 RepID=G3U055_LOXAF